MKKFVLMVFIAACLLASAGTAFAEVNSGGNGTASTTIVGLLGLDQVRVLDFGWWYKPAEEATVSLTAEETTYCTTTGGPITLAAVKDQASGKFVVSGGLTGTPFCVTCDETATLVGPTSSMTVALTPPQPAGESFTFDEYGEAIFYVGGTLTIAANQDIGAYVGYYDVSVAYY